MNNYRTVLEMYPDHISATDLAHHIGRVIQYYKEGDEWHKRHSHPLDRGDYLEHIQFLNEFRSLTEDMATEEESSLIIQDEFLKLNLNAWLKFLKKYTLEEVIFTFRGIKACMLDYLNMENIVAYRDCIKILDRIEYAITLMILEN